MATDILLLLLGLALIIAGAQFLIEGAASIAKRYGVSEFVIGLTIVGMGTSAPEMVVSFMGAIAGNSDIAIGNIVGSNIINALLILGITALLMPMALSRTNLRRDIPMNLCVTLLLILLGMHGTLFGLGKDCLSRADGLVFLAVFAAYMYYSFRYDPGESAESETKSRNPWLSALMVLGGLAALIFGGRVFVDAAVGIARLAGVSDKFIAVTILAGGTSMPELATCLVAAARKKGQLALGDIIGSNIFNILLILGGSSLICPLSFGGVGLTDLGVLLIGALLIGSSALCRKKCVLGRAGGILMLLVYAAYMAWLFTGL